MLVNTNSAIRYYSSFHSRSTMYIYCHYKSVFLSDNVRCIILFLLFIDRNVLLKLKSVSDMRKAFVIVHAYALFLWHSLTRTYSVSGKVHRNWGIIGMWAVWPSALIVYVGNLFKYIFNQIKIMPAVRILWLHFTIVYNSSGLKKIQWNRDNQKCLLLKWFSFDLSRFKSIPDPIRYICVWHEYFIRPFDYHY